VAFYDFALSEADVLATYGAEKDKPAKGGHR
jgi:hypothetical protein